MRVPIVIKIGGAVLDNLTRFWDQIKAMDAPVVIVPWWWNPVNPFGQPAWSYPENH